MCVQYCVCFANVIFWLVFLFVLHSAKHRSYTHACTCVLVYVLLCGCLLACSCDFIARDGVMCVVCMLALLKKILRQAPSKRHTLESIKKHLWYRK